MCVCSVMSNFLQPHGVQPSRLLCPGIFWARILEWIAISFSRGSSQPRDGNCLLLGRWTLHHCTTWEVQDEIVRWHRHLNGCEFEQTPGDSEGKGSLLCCALWIHRVRNDLGTEQQQKEMCVWNRSMVVRMEQKKKIR